MAPACCGCVLEHPSRYLLYLLKYSSGDPVHRYHLYIPTVFLKTALALQLHLRWDSDALKAERGGNRGCNANINLVLPSLVPMSVITLLS